MRKQPARRFTMRHRGRLILQLRRQPRFLDTQDDQVLLSAIKPIGSIDHLCQCRAMDKALRPQTIGRISSPPESKRPLTPPDDMYDHSPSLDTFKSLALYRDVIPERKSLKRTIVNLAWRAGNNGFAILLNDWY